MYPTSRKSPSHLIPSNVSEDFKLNKTSTMKVVLTSALFLFSSAPTWVGAFAPVGVIPTRTPQTFVAVQPLGATTTTAVNDATEQSSDFGTAMPTPNEEDPYAAFGLASPDELALGVEIKDLLKWIGTYVFVCMYFSDCRITRTETHADRIYC
jgi:hypothetical protein